MLIRRDEHNIDKLFRKKLHDANEEAPLHLWEGVRANNRRKRRLPLFWWWLGSAALVGGIALALVFQPEKGAELTANRNLNGSEVSSINMESNGSQSSHESDNTIEALPATVEKVELSKNPNQISTQPTERAKSVNVHPSHVSHNPPAKSIVSKSSFDGQQNLKTEQLFDAVLNAFAEQQNVMTEAEKLSLAADSEVPEKNTLIQDLAIENEILSGSSSWIETNIPESKEHWTSNRLMTGVGFSMANPVRKPSGNADQGLFALDQRTRPEPEMTLGWGVGYRVWKGLSVWSGLERSDFSENHHWRDSVDVIHFETFVDYEISYPGNDQNPVITAVVDTNFSQTKEVVTGMVRNRYTSWNVPLTLGWQQPVKGGFFLFAETGPVFRLNSRYEGMFVFTDTATPIIADQLSNFPMPTTTYDEKIYLRQYYKNWKMDWHAALSLGWMSKSGLGYSVGVRHRRMVGETGEQHDFSHRIQSTGFNIGIQYRF